MSQDIAQAVGHIPSGLFIVCASDRSKGLIDGYLASWIQQVSFKPLLVSLAIKPGRPAYDLIKSGQPFSINVVGDHDKSYLKHFWKGYDPAVNPFSEIEMGEGTHGASLLLAAKSSIECRLVDSFKPGDHEIVIAEVVGSYVHHNDAKPLTHIRKSGMDY